MGEGNEENKEKREMNEWVSKWMNVLMEVKVKDCPMVLSFFKCSIYKLIFVFVEEYYFFLDLNKNLLFRAL